jgi:nicotinamidase-related amidase
MANAVLVVDMLVGFLEAGHNLYCGDEARNVIPNVKRLIEREQAAGSKLFYICDNHDPDDLEFDIFPVHCVKGTAESKVIPELAEYPGVVIPKQRYSGFYGTGLGERLAELAPEKVTICGVCTDICVMHTAADARNRDYNVEVPVDCVASFDTEAHAFALQHMEKILGAKLVREARSTRS